MKIQIGTLMEETLLTQGQILQSLLSKYPQKELLTHLTQTEVFEPSALSALNETPQSDENPDFTFFSEIEAIVAEFRFPEEIENYVWSYPVYRMLSESHLSPTVSIQTQKCEQLTAEILTIGHQWIDFFSKKASPSLTSDEKNELMHAWTRFQSRVFEKSGQSRLRVL